jgi:hypothetical protein
MGLETPPTMTQSFFEAESSPLGAVTSTNEGLSSPAGSRNNIHTVSPEQANNDNAIKTLRDTIPKERLRFLRRKETRR